jgi:predicted metal-binding transcription factor (methanogenesis marker protein 9)
MEGEIAVTYLSDIALLFCALPEKPCPRSHAVSFKGISVLRR